MNTATWIFGGVLALYLGGYIVFRQLNVQVSEIDDQDYVVFSERDHTFYYIFRPLTYVDSAATGMRFHIGSPDADPGH